MEVPEEDDEKGPERRCAVTGERGPKERLLRFVVSPSDEVVPDVARRLPGRGIWLSPRRDVVNTAVAKKAFARAARRAVSARTDLADQVEALLVRRCLDDFGLARRAGAAVCGFDKVRAELDGRRVALLVLARDASEGQKAKMRGPAAGLRVIELFDGSELGAAFGRDIAVHVSLSPGAFAQRLLDDAMLLAGFRQASGVQDPG
jgi:predicted RNA-binding protein YlxR (DUF448 family)